MKSADERPQIDRVNWIGDAYPVNADPERDTWNGEPITARLPLADFLLARIAEDEQEAHEYQPHQGDVYEAAGWWDCDRVLVECEAKRRIVELHQHPDGSCWEMHRGVYGPGWPEGSYAVEGQAWAHPSLEPPEVHPGPCETLQLLALPYADHPDYREEWRA